MRLFRCFVRVLVLFTPFALIAPIQKTLVREGNQGQRYAVEPSAPGVAETRGAGRFLSSLPAGAGESFRVSALPPSEMEISPLKYWDEPEAFRKEAQKIWVSRNRREALYSIDELGEMRSLGLRAPLIP